MLQLEPTFQAKVSRLFREREIYVRSEGHIRFVTLKPYMLILVAGFLISLITTGIISSVGYYLERNSALAFREDLNKTTDTYKFTFEKSLADNQSQLKKLNQSVATKLKSQKKHHALELEKLRNAYELQLAQFQSSISQINGRMVNNQDAYLKELKRLRSVYTALQQRHAKLEDIMDQGWAPRMVTLPPQSLSDRTGSGVDQDNTLHSAPVNTGSVKPKKKSPLNTGSLFPENEAEGNVARLNRKTQSLKPVDVANLKSSMQNHWNKQNSASDQINFSARKRVKEMIQVLSRLKFRLPEQKYTPAVKPQMSTGGPFVELAFSDVVTSVKGFGALEFAAQQSFKKIFLLEKALLELPIRRPLSDLRSITSPFGPRMDPFRRLYAMHRGIDFRAPIGEPVLATAKGVVVLTQKNSKTGYGKLLVIRHEHGITTLYGHLDEFSVKVGDRVRPGDVVGKVGNTGRSTGPHLHYEIRVADSHVDPIDYLEAATHVF